MDNQVLERLKELYERDRITLHEEKDGLFSIVQDGEERILTEGDVLYECRKNGWLSE